MKRLIIFLVVTFGLTWGILIPAGIYLGTFENGETSSMTMIVLIAVSMFFPLIGALVVHFASKPEERFDLGFKPRFEGNIKYYLIAWLGPAVISLLGCIVYFALNPQLFDPTMMSYLELTAAETGIDISELTANMPSMPILIAATLFSSLTYAPLINSILAFGEEAGWRGMLYPALTKLMPVRGAVVVSGIIWGLWHAPAIAMGHNYGMDYAGFPIAGILVMILACTAMGCCLAWLREKSCSVWPCALAHGAFNAIANLGMVFSTVGPTLFGPSPLTLVAGIPLFALGIVCLVKFTPRRDSKQA